ncbi:MAG: hypothetical protein HY271_19720 [Deltaproteobacteria bacterium]|nr:hypothetical protein [Deltaproteobacteria bacterium]
MRVHATTSVIAVALVALSFVAGCGDSTNTDITLGDEPTPTPATARTATPVVGRTATPVATATPGTVATATTGSNPTPTATPGSSVDADVQAVVSDLLPFLTTGPTLLSGGSASALTAGSAAIITSVEALKNDPCPDGGSRVDDEGLPVRTITLTTCRVSDPQLGSFEFDGTITITISLQGCSIDFDFTSKDLLNNDHTVHFSGSLTGPPQLSGFVLDGQVVVATLKAILH